MPSDSTRHTDNGKNKFLICHQLLSRWQVELEYYLYYFCKATAPQLLLQNDWSFFSSHGIPVQERESFCVKLQEVCQIQNFAVHQVTLHTSTLQKYARVVQEVLGLLRRLGGENFQQSCTNHVSQPTKPFSEAEVNKKQKELNIEQAIQKQRLAAQKRASNISLMIEEFQASKRARDMHRYQNQQQNKDTECRRAERAKKARKEQEDARLRRAQKAINALQ
ncbi:hypothetical protein BDW71DRAFT_196336 [Aspergillus fruticulosus]